jgi:hypothetical protein
MCLKPLPKQKNETRKYEMINSERMQLKVSSHEPQEKCNWNKRSEKNGVRVEQSRKLIWS